MTDNQTMPGFGGMPSSGTRVSASDKLPGQIAEGLGTATASTGEAQPGELGSAFPSAAPEPAKQQGLSPGVTAAFSGESLRQPRAYSTFTLPEGVIPSTWKFDDRYRSFSVVELTPSEEDKAISNAGQGVKLQQAFTEMVSSSIYMIGGERATFQNRRHWLKEIGPRGRKCVEGCFTRLNGIDDAMGEECLATKQDGFG